MIVPRLLLLLLLSFSLQAKPLLDKKEIVVCSYGERMPYMGHDREHTFGIIYDYYKAFEKHIGVPMRFVHEENLDICVKRLETKRVDAISSVGKPNTLHNVALSDTYGEDFLAIVTPLQYPYLQNMAQLEGKKIGVIKHYRNMIAALHEHFPRLNFVPVSSTKEGMEKVARKELFAYIDIYRIAAYAIAQAYVGELKVNTKIPGMQVKAHVGVRKGDETLLQAFNGAIASLPAEEKRRMIDEWMRAKQVVKPNYRLIGEIIGLTLLLLLAFLYHHLKMRYRHKALLTRQAKLAGMGSMINSIAHQWRQPLTRVNSNITVLKSLLEDPVCDRALLKEKLDSIEESTAYMSDTIEDFMHFFDPQKSKSRFVLRACVEKAAEMNGMSGRPVGLQVKVDGAITLYSYEKELTQVLLVLLNNAVENFVIRGVSHPSISLEAFVKENKVHLLVCDNGGGISEQEIDRIFEPYYTTKTRDEGRGIGLYMATLLIEESMGGELLVENRDGGACFEIILPREEKNG